MNAAQLGDDQHASMLVELHTEHQGLLHKPAFDPSACGLPSSILDVLQIRPDKRSTKQVSDVRVVIKNLGWEPMSSMRQKALSELLRTAEILTVEAGESLWDSAEGSDSAYVLIEGRLELNFTFTGDQGAPRIVSE